MLVAMTHSSYTLVPRTQRAAPDWRLPAAAEPVPLVAFDDPCALRSRAQETLSVHGIPAEVNCEAAHLAGARAQGALLPWWLGRW